MQESGETIISGMGELHLDVYIECMKREYNAIVVTSPPQVAYRETITQRAEFNYTHKKQTGGRGQYGRVVGWIEPYTEGDFEFVDDVKGGSIPREFISSVEKGFRSMLCAAIAFMFGARTAILITRALAPFATSSKLRPNLLCAVSLAGAARDVAVSADGKTIFVAEPMCGRMASLQKADEFAEALAPAASDEREADLQAELRRDRSLAENALMQAKLALAIGDLDSANDALEAAGEAHTLAQRIPTGSTKRPVA